MIEYIIINGLGVCGEIKRTIESFRLIIVIIIRPLALYKKRKIPKMILVCFQMGAGVVLLLLFIIVIY